ncbi:hypothetical protein LOZ15_006883, partial [Ophidiomyces ophidiicola]
SLRGTLQRHLPPLPGLAQPVRAVPRLRPLALPRQQLQDRRPFPQPGLRSPPRHHYRDTHRLALAACCLRPLPARRRRPCLRAPAAPRLLGPRARRRHPQARRPSPPSRQPVRRAREAPFRPVRSADLLERGAHPPPRPREHRPL